jgi:hypothetical protein
MTARSNRRLPMVRTLAMGLASGAVLAGVLPEAWAQQSTDPTMRFELVPPEDFTPADPAPVTSAISVRAQVDVMFEHGGDGSFVLIQNAFETGAAGENMSSDYVFALLNQAALAGLDEAVGKGAKTGRANVVAVCYRWEIAADGTRSMVPMGVFINTTDMNLSPDGIAAFHTNVKFVPPYVRNEMPAPPVWPPPG